MRRNRATTKPPAERKVQLANFSIRVRTSLYEFVVQFIDDAPPQTNTGAIPPLIRCVGAGRRTA
ncbi:MAG: hypothetical protein L6244_01965 [Candidatus Methanoperedenaceae archaeon]|nr:hypothetical protein [Candidatus Methanoperedenaceae archaeon]